MKTGGISSKSLVATIGFFDGVHLGHRFLISQVNEVARSRGYASAVVTFPEHPRKVMQPDFAPRLLNTCEEKLSLLAAAGVQQTIMQPFTKELAALSARDFMQLLQRDYKVQALLIGHDHRFGHNRSEGFDDYLNYAKELGMEVLLARAYLYKDIKVSSSKIRHHLLQGEMMEATALLGYEYVLQGTVVGGYRIGRRLGYPTANIRPDSPEKLIPCDGVYAVRVQLGASVYGGMLSIGYRPTLGNGPDRSIEVHIFDFHEDIYDCPIRLSFVARTRDDLKFDTLEELKERLQQDEKEIRAILC
ncbi:MAG: bifunctional riboflavin kinase/FAD synthetase [Bacteroides sp.]|nr:bifunctional riboflavin kinase/FAD synthetase [Bacteroides sp.]